MLKKDISMSGVRCLCEIATERATYQYNGSNLTTCPWKLGSHGILVFTVRKQQRLAVLSYLCVATQMECKISVVS